MKSEKMNDRLSVGGQPTADDLRRLRNEGFATVVNLRREGESTDPFDPAGEGEAASAIGLEYHHIPVDPSAPERAQVEAVRKAISEAKGPVYVH
jgi:uncharacterized protein (TIGR01244 family)